MIKTIPNGVFSTMLTPYTADNKIDFAGVEKLLYWYKDHGCTGVFAICQSSEIFFLSFEERLELIKFIMSHKPEGLTVVASGHTAKEPERQIYEANAFIDTGIDAYVFISNRFAEENESDDVLWKNMNRMIESIPEIALGVYECPYPYKRLLTPYLLKKMSETGKFQFLKDTCCDLVQIREKLNAVQGSGLKIYNANAATLLESLKMGCAGYSSVMANFHPEFYAELVDCCKENPAKAELLQNIVGFMSVAECQCYPVNAKYYLKLDGVDINIDSRSRSKADFTPNRMLEIEQMYALTKEIKAKLL